MKAFDFADGDAGDIQREALAAAGDAVLPRGTAPDYVGMGSEAIGLRLELLVDRVSRLEAILGPILEYVHMGDEEIEHRVSRLEARMMETRDG